MPLAVSAIAKNPESQSKGALVRAVETLSRRGASFKAQWEKGKLVAAATAENFAGVGTGAVSFGGLFYLRRRRVHKGKRNTFDKGGKIDAFFWPGLVVSVVGCIPFMGVDKPLVPSMLRAAGQSSMFVGMTDFIDAMALKHATAP